jgi:hypothetical protein
MHSFWNNKCEWHQGLGLLWNTGFSKRRIGIPQESKQQDSYKDVWTWHWEKFGGKSLSEEIMREGDRRICALEFSKGF